MQQSGQPEWDTLIRNACVIDGSGSAPVTQDVAIAQGRIAARGVNLSGSAGEEIDATGLWLMPGLLDIHTHFDLEVEVLPGLPEAVRHGTTTVVVSNCSLGLAYGAQRKEGTDPIVDCFARVENVPKPVLKAVADRAVWSDSKGYLQHLNELPLGANIVPMIPHSMLRIEVMGFQASVSRDPTVDELARMAALIETGMQEGYVGFSTDALPFHFMANDPNRRRRIPTQHASYKELKQLTEVVRQYDRVWQATPPKDNPLQVFRNFLLSSGRLFGKRLKITSVAALDIVSNRGLLRLSMLLTRVLNSKIINGEFAMQALAAPFKVWGEGPITPIFEEIPVLRWLNEPDLEDRAARRKVLDNPEYLPAFKEMWNRGKHDFGVSRLKRWLAMEDYSFTRDLRDMIIDRCPVDEWAGLSLHQVFLRLQRYKNSAIKTDGFAANEQQCFDRMPGNRICEAQFLVELFKQFDTDLYWYAVYANRDAERTLDTLLHPNILPGFNDSGAHLSNMAFYDANLRGLKAADARGLDTVAYLVKRLTRDPAQFFDIDAGTIEIGDIADVTLIDPDALRSYDSESCTRTEYRDEFKFSQLVNRSDGVVAYVFVAGHLAWNKTGYTAEHGKQKWGRALRAKSAQNHRQVCTDDQSA